MRSVCVFCGSHEGTDPAFRAAARRFGALLAREGLGLVTGGGSVGLMGEMADAVLDGGGEAIGVIPRALLERELGHARLTRLEEVDTMHERKARMAALADGFVALPGGMGTLDELCEIVTWAQLGIHAKPCALLDVAGYWAGFLRFLDHAVEQGFVRPEHRAMVLVDDDPERLLAAMRAYAAPPVRRWVQPGEV